MKFLFNVESEEGEVRYSSCTLSDTVKKFIELSKEQFVLLEVYNNGVNTFTHGLYTNESITDEMAIKANICDGMFG